MIYDIHSHIALCDEQFAISPLLKDMDRFAIQKRVISYPGYDNLKQYNRMIVALTKNYPERLIACAMINPCCSTAIDDVKDALSMKEVQMIEFNSSLHGYYPDKNEKLDSIFKELAKRKLPVKIFSGMGAKSLPQQWTRYVEAYPEITFIFLHMGCFDYGYGCVDMVAHYPNTMVETSNQYELQILRKAFKELPKEKIIFGSSYPERFTRNALEVFDLFELTNEETANIMYANAETIL